MGYLDELKKLVADNFEKADPSIKTKEYIDNFAQINRLIDSAVTENKTLVDNNAELSKSYKELVMHGTTSAKVPSTASEPGIAEPPSFEKMLEEFGKDNRGN